MANRTKEEERLLDEKIARIQKKNEEILKREKEIEEDKRLAAKHNAIVQLRSSSTSDSRERTPAMRLSKRELSNNILLEVGDSAEANAKYAQSVPRGIEGRRGRDRGDRIEGGPPPDPRSYLADAERDPIPPARDGRGDEFRNNRGMRGDVRGSSRGGFQRGSRRGRGKSDYGRGRDEDAWRAERNRIDEERIQRQKSSDGSWRREWDSEKIEQEFDDERYAGNRGGPNSQPDRWKSNYSQQSNQRLGNVEFDRPNRGSYGAKSHRGRLDNQDYQHLEKNISPPTREHFGKSRHVSDNHFTTSSRHQEEPILIKQISNHIEPEKTMLREDTGIKRTIDNEKSKTVLKYPPTSPRSVIDVGGSFKISVSNTSVPSESASITSKTPRRPNQDFRHRHKSQASYSSQSEDEAYSLPQKERSYRGGRNRGLVYNSNKGHGKHIAAQHEKEDSIKSNTDEISNKPPLPLIKSSQTYEVINQEGSKGPEDGEESWEDVTTSGTESIGEEVRSFHSSPNSILNTSTVTKNTNESVLMEDIYSPEDFLIIQRYEDTYIEESHDFHSENNSANSSNPCEKGEEFIEDTKQIIEKENIDVNECNIEQIEYIKNNDAIEEVEKTEVKSVNTGKPLLDSDEVADVKTNEITLISVSDENKISFEYRENVGEHSSIKEMEKTSDIPKAIEEDNLKTDINTILNSQNDDNEKEKETDNKETDVIQSLICNKECETKEDTNKIYE